MASQENIFGGEDIFSPVPTVQNSVSLVSNQAGLISGESPGPKSAIIGTTVASAEGNFTMPAVGDSVTVTLQAGVSISQNTPFVVSVNGIVMICTAVIPNVSNAAVATFVPSASSIPPANPPTYPTPNNLTIVSGSTIDSITVGNELPPGRMGAYGQGRNWMCLPDGKSFVASDLVGDPSGTPALQYRDAVLKVTENTYLSGGGSWRVPSSGSSINAMIFTALMDSSLGQGPLQVLTDDRIFSCQAPVDRSTWATLQNPILPESVITNGGLSQWSTVLANSDVIYRATDGIRSQIQARREFYSWGNTPISFEVNPTLTLDTKSLLNYSSAVVFDNRLFMTVNPQAGPLGVYHNAMAVLNFDPISSLRGKQPSIWEGIWGDLNILQLVTGKFNGVQRAFAFCYNPTTNTIGLFEIKPDTFTATVPIVSVLNLPVFDFGEKDPRKRQFKELYDGEIYMDSLVGDVSVVTQYHPDYDQNWHSWTSFVIPDGAPYQPRLGLDRPPLTSDAGTQLTPGGAGTGRPYRCGYYFQMQLVISGVSWRLMGGKVVANPKPEPHYPPMQPLQSPQ